MPYAGVSLPPLSDLSDNYFGLVNPIGRIAECSFTTAVGRVHLVNGG
jgi:hypothetical protein